MCYFVEINLTRIEMQKRFGATMPEYFKWEPMPFVSGFAFPEVPVLVNTGAKAFVPAHWGLIPHWVSSRVKADEIRAHTLNAMSETVHEKPSFRKAFAQNRCILPASGYFEWHHRDKEKFPFYISSSEQRVLAMAGIMDVWTDRETGEIIHSFAVCTTPANSMMSRIHNSKRRMPAILAAGAEEEWLSSSLSSAMAKELLQPFPDDKITAFPIARFNPSTAQGNFSPDMLKPVEYKNLVW
ncbi:MAG: SOS response-associated peptidase [Bacteroidales bacterium]